MIHRDVKPANIVITTDGMVKVVDFGIARIADASKTQTGMLLGTLAYMSPEQLRGQHADARCDIWALGVVLYELITYRRPFTGDNHAALLLNILQNEPPSIRQLLTDCPIQLQTVVSRALRKDDKERYANHGSAAQRPAECRIVIRERFRAGWRKGKPFRDRRPNVARNAAH